MGYNLAQLMVIGWPIVVIVIFQRLPVPRAILVSIVAGYLLVPLRPTYNFPVLPAWDKELVTALPVFLMALIKTRAAGFAGTAAGGATVLEGWLPQNRLLLACVAAIVVGPFFTIITNGDPQNYPLRNLPGLSPYDAGSMVLNTLVSILPFFLARKFLGDPKDQTTLLVVLCVAGLAYSLPALWEVRMSPRLNVQIYGFFPHDWRQHLRAGGYRPVVFLEHGLKLGIFFTVTLLATIGYRRLAPDALKSRLVVAVIWIAGTLVLSKNLGAFIIFVLLAPVIWFLTARMQLKIAAIVAALVMTFPMIRAADLVPTNTIVSAVSSFADPARVRSLEYRFNTEDILLEKARERPLFGWGGWGRNRAYDERGRDLVSTDGGWILAFGERGWVGYLGRFGLLTLPIILLALKRRKEEEVPMATSALAVVLAANLVDLVPNTGLTPLTWILAGVLAGRLETRPGLAPGAEAEPAAEADPRATRYRRDFGPPSQSVRGPATSREARRETHRQSLGTTYRTR